MENPFESGHIKNYILAYVGVVVIMVLFFIASTLFNDIQKVQTKVFSTAKQPEVHIAKKEPVVEANSSTYTKFKLLEKAY